MDAERSFPFPKFKLEKCLHKFKQYPGSGISNWEHWTEKKLLSHLRDWFSFALWVIYWDAMTERWRVETCATQTGSPILKLKTSPNRIESRQSFWERRALFKHSAALTLLIIILLTYVISTGMICCLSTTKYKYDLNQRAYWRPRRQKWPREVDLFSLLVLGFDNFVPK